MAKIDFGTCAALAAGLLASLMFAVDPTADKGQGMVLAFFTGGLLGTVVRDVWWRKRFTKGCRP